MSLINKNFTEEIVSMEYDVFEKIVDDYKLKKPILFGLEHDEVCSAKQIEDFENMLRIEIPKKYKQFLMNFGGGYFGYANIYSLDKESSFFLLAHNDIPVGDYLRIADDGCGDYYLLSVIDKKCLDQLFFYEHDTNSIYTTEYADILEYLTKVGLKAN